MAISDLVSALQAVESSVSSRLSVVGVSVPVSSSTTILGISDSVEGRILGIDDSQSALSSKLSDLASLRTKLLALATATTQLENLPTTRHSNAIDTTGSSAANDTVDFDDNELTTAGLTLQNGDAVQFSSAFTTNISANTSYYVNVDSDDTGTNDVEVKLYTSRSGALAGGSTDLVNIAENGQGDGSGLAIITTLEDTTVEDLFDAFNEVQEFLEEITGDDGSLAGEEALSALGRELTTAMRGLLTSSDFLPLVEDSSDTRALTLDSTDLSTFLTTDGGHNIGQLLFEGATGVAAKLQNVVSNYAGSSGVINSLITSLQTSVRDSDSDVSSLLQRAQSDQLESVNTIAKIAGAITTSTKQIDFLGALFG